MTPFHCSVLSLTVPTTPVTSVQRESQQCDKSLFVFYTDWRGFFAIVVAQIKTQWPWVLLTPLELWAWLSVFGSPVSWNAKSSHGIKCNSERTAELRRGKPFICRLVVLRKLLVY